MQDSNMTDQQRRAVFLFRVKLMDFGGTLQASKVYSEMTFSAFQKVGSPYTAHLFMFLQFCDVKVQWCLSSTMWDDFSVPKAC